MILVETCKLLQLSGEFPCHVNLQPAPYQSSVAQSTNSALSIPVGWMIKKVSRNGNKKAKVQIRWKYLQVEAIFRHSGMQFFFCFLFSLFPVPTPSFLPATTKKAKERERENEKNGFSTWLETKIISRKEVRKLFLESRRKKLKLKKNSILSL